MESIILDDGIEYFIVDTKEIDNTVYTLFSNVNNDKDICFRKVKKINDEEVYIGLDNETELQKVMLYFCKENLK